MPVDITDVSGNNMHLTNSGNVQYMSEGLTPFYRFSGSNYLYYPDAAAPEYNILGNEAYVNAKGLTVMCWARTENVSSSRTLVSKESAGQNQYALQVSNLSNPLFRVSTDGSALVQAVATSALFSLNQWIFYCGRWAAGGAVQIYVDDVLTSGANVSAPLFSGTATFQVGARAGTLHMDGDISMVGVYGSALSEDQILTIYDMTAPLFKAAL